ncbi:MAG TPA: hypothetical protein VJ694_05240 [Patescibacteria group bacterium]|nr:hypothetical protein [Patescibacteria group bacterium]
MSFERPDVEDAVSDPVKAALGSIMTFKEYAETEHPTPYVFELGEGGRELEYYGSRHVTDPEDPLFDDVRRKFGAFLERHEPEECVVFIEGGLHPAGAFGSDEEAAKMGEPAFTQRLAERAGVKVASPEPGEDLQTEAMRAEGFGDDEIAAYWIIKQMKYAHDIEGRVPTARDLGRWFLSAREWTGADWVPGAPDKKELRERLAAGDDEVWKRVEDIGAAAEARLKDVFKTSAGKEFDLSMAEAYSDPADLSGMKSRFNRIAAISSEVRDREIVRAVGEAVAAGKSAFVVYGASHAVMQEPAFKKLFSSL